MGGMDLYLTDKSLYLTLVPALASLMRLGDEGSRLVQVVLDPEAVKNAPAKEFTAERFYDNSLVQALISEGFYKSLWGK